MHPKEQSKTWNELLLLIDLLRALLLHALSIARNNIPLPFTALPLLSLAERHSSMLLLANSPLRESNIGFYPSDKD